jgi:hypothetical protein
MEVNNDVKQEGMAEKIFKTLTSTSILDPDFSPEKVESTKIFSDKELIDHLTNKENLSDEEIEQLKRSAKYQRFLG